MQQSAGRTLCAWYLMCNTHLTPLWRRQVLFLRQLYNAFSLCGKRNLPQISTLSGICDTSTINRGPAVALTRQCTSTGLSCGFWHRCDWVWFNFRGRPQRIGFVPARLANQIEIRKKIRDQVDLEEVWASGPKIQLCTVARWSMIFTSPVPWF